MKPFPLHVPLDEALDEARLTLRLLPVVASVRWRLWRTPFARLQRQWRDLVQGELDRSAPLSARLDESDLTAKVWREAHAVRRAARLVPRGSCLTQAMALQLVLARRGEPCSVRIGVDRNLATKNSSATASAGGADTASSRFEAHAWVEWQDRVILGGDISRWKPLTVFAPATVTRPVLADGERT